MAHAGFRSLIDGATNFARDPQAVQQLPVTPGGGAPTPFDAVERLRMSGPQGSHPLALIDLPELLPPPTRGLEGSIELDRPARVGESISGRIHVRARREIRARSAVLRLVGVRLAERTRSATEEPDGVAGRTGSTGSASSAATTRTVRWVEVRGEIIESLPFTEPVLPASLDAGQVVEAPFTIPAPSLGPPTAHAGVAAVAWALEAQWDIGMAADERVCAHVDVRQHPDLLRAGVITLPSGAMNDMVTDEDATISVEPLPPIPAGTPVTASIAWPGAPGGRSARVELGLQVRGDSRLDLVLARADVDGASLAGSSITLPIEADLPPTLETPGLEVGYHIRMTVDRKLRSDVHRERAIVIY